MLGVTLITLFLKVTAVFLATSTLGGKEALVGASRVPNSSTKNSPTPPSSKQLIL